MGTALSRGVQWYNLDSKKFDSYPFIDGFKDGESVCLDVQACGKNPNNSNTIRD